MKVGRPTDYTPELLEKAKAYLSLTQDEFFENRVKVNLPSIAGLAKYLGISRQTIYEWSRQEGKEEFTDILERILAEQELRLLNNGLSGTYNSNIVKLALGKHGYTDKQDLTTDGKPMTALVQFLDGKESNNSDPK